MKESASKEQEKVLEGLENFSKGGSNWQFKSHFIGHTHG